MERYIEQLIDDIHKATRNLKSPHRIREETNADLTNEIDCYDISHIEKYYEGEGQYIAQITGIDPENLPPAEMLTKKQQALLAKELEQLLLTFHFVLDFPHNFPAHLRYSFIREFWNEKQVALSFGENHIEFCEYEEENCPFPGYCSTCREIEAQLKSDEKYDDITGLESETDDL
jgi:hypothetical protein